MSKKLKFVKDFFTKEDIRRLRRSLEESTEKAFKRFAEAKRISWQKAKRIILD